MCMNCDMCFSTRCELRSHVIGKHTNNRSYKCGECEYSAKFKTHLNGHIRRRHMSTKDQLQCSIPRCNFRTNCQENVKKHVKNMHGESLKLFACSEEKCDREFTKLSNMKYHVKASHKMIKDFQCEECDFETSSKAGLRCHATNNHAEKTGSLCSVCQKTCMNVEEHMKRVHSGQAVKKSLITCLLCKKNFIHIKNHMKSMHSERNEKCHICAKAFANTCNLKKHIKGCSFE